MAISSGARTRIFVKEQTAYETAEALAAADYVRTTGGGVTIQPFGYTESPERTPGDDLQDSIRTERIQCSVSLGCLMRGAPNGTGAPDQDPMLKSVFGADPIIVDAVGDTTDSGNAGKVVGVVSSGAGGDGLIYPVVAKVGGATTTVAVPGSAAYATRNYNLGRDVNVVTVREQPTDAGSVQSATPARLSGAPAKVASAWAVSTAAIAIDGTGAATVQYDGPARTALQGDQAGADIDVTAPARAALVPKGVSAKVWFQDASTPPGQPAAWTELATGFRTMTVTIDNQLMVINDESGSNLARGVYRTSRRMVTVEMTTYAEEQQGLWDAIHDAQATGPYTALIVTAGTVEGGRYCLFMPRVRFNLPNADGAEEAQGWTFTGRAHAAADGAQGVDSSVALMLG